MDDEEATTTGADSTAAGLSVNGISSAAGLDYDSGAEVPLSAATAASTTTSIQLSPRIGWVHAGGQRVRDPDPSGEVTIKGVQLLAKTAGV